MQIEKTILEGVLIITPKVFQDNRGYFYESFSAKDWEDAGLTNNFVQDNQSLSGKGILRGLHFQAPPYAQGKLVRVVKGAVLDVAVDIRKNSPTYGKHVAVELSETNFKMMWVPAGFAHGFLTLEEDTIFTYKCTNTYNKESEGGLMWNDPAIGIDWKLENPILSDKDKDYLPLEKFRSPF
jgi:dTDP-4-dehydrorhamnose 3,5-epimerase